MWENSNTEGIIMTMQEQIDLWNELVKQICEFR